MGQSGRNHAQVEVGEFPQVLKEGARILVVAGDRTFRSLVRKTLDEHQYKTVEADDGHGALEKVSSSEVDAAIIDLETPNVNGIEFARRVRSAHPNFPVIMITAFSQFYSLEDILSSGVDGVLHKPVDLNHLIGALRQL